MKKASQLSCRVARLDQFPAKLQHTQFNKSQPELPETQ